uniref:Uncharacterized protein n=1 Tax=Physcomitrium patens TaxID=3218 RepID=A0A2K1K6U1_PHYPA|nr:hypothetical protein PHYPA_011384 [Physcomitrium patens]
MMLLDVPRASSSYHTTPYHLNSLTIITSTRRCCRKAAHQKIESGNASIIHLHRMRGRRKHQNPRAVHETCSTQPASHPQNPEAHNGAEDQDQNWAAAVAVGDATGVGPYPATCRFQSSTRVSERHMGAFLPVSRMMPWSRGVCRMS